MTTTDDDLRFMRLAIDEMKKCVDEPGRKSPAPMVGAVVVKDGAVLAATHRGCGDPGAHAEYIALEKKIPHDQSTAGAVLYTTLEPCTTRNHPKIPCAARVGDRQFFRVFVGMVDPDPRITGKGIRRLQQRGVEVLMFPKELVDEIEDLNRKFTRSVEAASATPPPLVAPASPSAMVIQHVGGDVIVSTGQSGGVTGKDVTTAISTTKNSGTKLLGVGIVVFLAAAAALTKAIIGPTAAAGDPPRASASTVLPATVSAGSPPRVRLTVDENRNCQLINDGDLLKNVELMHGFWLVNTKTRRYHGAQPSNDKRLASKPELTFAEKLSAVLPDLGPSNMCRRMNTPEGCKIPDDCVALFACATQLNDIGGKRWEFEQLLASPLSDDGACKLTAVYMDFLEDSKPFDRTVRAAVQVIDENRGIQEFQSRGLDRSLGPRVRGIHDESVLSPALPTPPSTRTSQEPPPLAAPASPLEVKPVNDDKKALSPALNISNVTGDVVVSHGQTGGVTAHTVNVNAPPTRGLTADQRARVVAALAQGKGARIRVEIVGGDDPAEFARVLDTVFREAEWSVGRITKVGNVSRRGVTARAREPLPNQVGVLVAALGLGGVEVAVLPDPRMDEGDVWLQVGAQ